MNASIHRVKKNRAVYIKTDPGKGKIGVFIGYERTPMGIRYQIEFPSGYVGLYTKKDFKVL